MSSKAAMKGAPLEELARLEGLVAEQGARVRELKKAKAEKEVLAAAVRPPPLCTKHGKSHAASVSDAAHHR